MNPDFFVQIIPSYIPHQKLMVLISGLAEILGGIGIMLPFSKTFTGWGLIFLLIAVFPANIEMFLKAYQKQGFSTYTLLTLVRLPLQFVLICWVYWATELTLG